MPTTQANLVHETSVSTGTGNFTTTVVNGKQRFSDAGAFGTGVTLNVFDYFISNRDVAEWERGTGHMSAVGTLVRDTPIEGSAGAATLVTFSAGTKDITNDIPALEQMRKSNALSELTASAATARTNILALGSVIPQKFTASGTYTPTAGMRYCIIECVGGGGAGGGATSTANNLGGGGGGGSGGYSRLIASAATIGASKAVTIGAGGTAGTAGNNPGNAGGDTSVGALCIGKGGSGGAGAGGAGLAGGSGGAGGVAGTGDFTPAGSSGFTGNAGANTTVIFPMGGQGGSSQYGGGGIGTIVASAVVGNAGNLYGGGGSGAASTNGNGAFAGGVGAAGVVFITEFF